MPIYRRHGWSHDLRGRATRRGALGVGVAAGWAGLFGVTDLAAKKGKKKCPKKKCPEPAGDCCCDAGQQCFTNGGCGLVCDATYLPCPTGCICDGGFDTMHVCLGQVPEDCFNAPQRCDSTASCPAGTICRSLICSGTGESRCVPLCGV